METQKKIILVQASLKIDINLFEENGKIGQFFVISWLIHPF
jgi:hypothetical protein